jgi:hypothetical protein
LGGHACEPISFVNAHGIIVRQSGEIIGKGGKGFSKRGFNGLRRTGEAGSLTGQPARGRRGSVVTMRGQGTAVLDKLRKEASLRGRIGQGLNRLRKTPELEANSAKDGSAGAKSPTLILRKLRHE